MRSLIQIYALAVCFATMMCLAIALGVGLYDLVQVAVPSFTLPYSVPFESNESYLQHNPDKKDLPTEEVAALRVDGLRQALHGERRAALQSGVFAFIIVTIDIGLFVVHWRLARREAGSGSQMKNE